MPPKSKKQAGFLGAVAAGKARKRGGPTRSQAREMLRGSRVKGLPARKGSTRKSRSTKAQRQPRTSTGRFK